METGGKHPATGGETVAASLEPQSSFLEQQTIAAQGFREFSVENTSLDESVTNHSEIKETKTTNESKQRSESTKYEMLEGEELARAQHQRHEYLKAANANSHPDWDSEAVQLMINNTHEDGDMSTPQVGILHGSGSAQDEVWATVKLTKRGHQEYAAVQTRIGRRPRGPNKAILRDILQKNGTDQELDDRKRSFAKCFHELFDMFKSRSTETRIYLFQSAIILLAAKYDVKWKYDSWTAAASARFRYSKGVRIQSGDEDYIENYVRNLVDTKSQQVDWVRFPERDEIPFSNRVFVEDQISISIVKDFVEHGVHSSSEDRMKMEHRLKDAFKALGHPYNRHPSGFTKLKDIGNGPRYGQDFVNTVRLSKHCRSNFDDIWKACGYDVESRPTSKKAKQEGKRSAGGPTSAIPVPYTPQTVGTNLDKQDNQLAGAIQEPQTNGWLSTPSNKRLTLQEDADARPSKQRKISHSESKNLVEQEKQAEGIKIAVTDLRDAQLLAKEMPKIEEAMKETINIERTEEDKIHAQHPVDVLNNKSNNTLLSEKQLPEETARIRFVSRQDSHHPDTPNLASGRLSRVFALCERLFQGVFSGWGQEQ
ncbi:MAG: hypothetical protein Q9227_001958 [Pyrenula ochraceoflavens]